MRILALTLGAVTGFALGSAGEMVSGTWKPGQPLADRLAELSSVYAPQRIVLVEQDGAKGEDREALAAWAAGCGIPCSAMSFQEAASAWSGTPAVSADEMIGKTKLDGIEAKTTAQALAVAAFFAA